VSLSVRVLATLALLGWFGVILFDGLWAGPLFRTEALRALVADEMVRSGNWLVPHCYHAPLLTKPPGAYVAIALASLPAGGVEEWSARLPSAVAGGLCMLLLGWHFGRRLGASSAWIVAALLAMSALWLEKVPTAEIDSLQVFWVTASLVFFFRAIDAENELASWGQRQFWWTAALICVTGGFLTKWTAPAFFYLTAIPLLWWRGRLRLLFGRCHLLAAVTAATVALAWIAAVVIQTGPYLLRQTLAREALMRLLPSEHDRAYPWLEVLTHPLRVVAAALPGSLAAIIACRRSFGMRLDECGRRTWQEMHCWIWPNLLFWTIIPEHATRHSFPLLPGLAGLAALVWTAWLHGNLHWPVLRIQPRQVLAAALGIWLIVKLFYVHGILPAQYQQRDVERKAEQLAEAVPPSSTIYICRAADDGLQGILFYYSKRHADDNRVPVERLGLSDHLPSSAEPIYCIVDERDWDADALGWCALRQQARAQRVYAFRDERDVPLLLVRVEPG
jgi:4-amino-4-deoxy-L-arabinose transferase-like glycosyltransferase